jgi:hypothetical protein
LRRRRLATLCARPSCQRIIHVATGEFSRISLIEVAARIDHRLWLRTQTFTRQQKVEAFGGIQISGRSPDRNCRAIRGKLAGQYYRNDGALTDVGGVAIVFHRFDDECHVVRRISQTVR